MERNCDMFLFQDEKRVVFYFFSAVGSFFPLLSTGWQYFDRNSLKCLEGTCACMRLCPRMCIKSALCVRET